MKKIVWFTIFGMLLVALGCNESGPNSLSEQDTGAGDITETGTDTGADEILDADTYGDLPPDADYTESVSGITIDMVFVQGGTYERGCDTCDSLQPNGQDDQVYETPEHTVTVSDFHAGKTEVTVAQWKAIMGDSYTVYGNDDDNAPFIGTNWFDANEFVCRLNELTGRTYRLLTDAEWEFAARGGNGSRGTLYSGSDNPDDVAWTSSNSNGSAHDVATLDPNELGIYDMSGNAFEWVYDWLTQYSGDNLTNPVQLTGQGNKTRRGGAYGEPEVFSRVSRRAIRSRDGSAGMGFRIAHSKNGLNGMDDPCIAAAPPKSDCEGSEYRDCRLITEDGEAWIAAPLSGTGSGYPIVFKANGAAAIDSPFGGVSGDWYTLNNRSMNIVSNGQTSIFAYYVFSADEITMIAQNGTPYRAQKQSLADAGITAPDVPAPVSPLEQLIADVQQNEPERIVSAEELVDPDENERDLRLLPGDGKTWFMDGRCCGGNHKYRFHLEANGDAEFVVMDYDTTAHENILATGKWFTSGNIALHIKYEGKYYNYLYTVGTRTVSFSQYMPAGPIYSHISFQEYERGDFRIFSNYDDTEAVHRPQTFSFPVYPPGDYQPNSDGN